MALTGGKGAIGSTFPIRKFYNAIQHSTPKFTTANNLLYKKINSIDQENAYRIRPAPWCILRDLQGYKVRMFVLYRKHLCTRTTSERYPSIFRVEMSRSFSHAINL